MAQSRSPYYEFAVVLNNLNKTDSGNGRANIQNVFET